MDCKDHKPKFPGKARHKNKEKPKNNGPSLCQCLKDERCDSGLVDSVGPRTIKFSIFQPQEFQNKRDKYCQGQETRTPNSFIAENPNYKKVVSPQKSTVVNSTQQIIEKSLPPVEDKIELKEDPLKNNEPQVLSGEEEIVEERKSLKENLVNVDQAVDEVPSPVESPIAEIIPEVDQTEEKVSVATS